MSLSLVATVALGTAALLVAPAPRARAQGSTLAATAPATNTITGTFKFKDGTAADARRGTFVSTVITSSATTTTQTVYTDRANGQTRTATSVVTANDNGSRIVDLTILNFDGSTYHSTRTDAKVKAGYAGQGTFTGVDGSTGTIETLETVSEATTIVSTDSDSAVHGQSHTLNVSDNVAGVIVDETFTTKPDGSTGVDVFTRYVTGAL